MAEQPQVISARFNGVPCSVDFTLSLGTSPGVGTITFPDTGLNVAKKGTLVLSDGQSTIVLNSIYADKPRVEGSADSGYSLVATICDRRFAWQWGWIVGRWNQRSVDGVPTEERTLRDLIKDCLEQLNEDTYDLAGIPVEYPEVDWEGENPANALQDLCEKYSLVIGMDSGASNPIVICPYDYARDLPIGGVEEETTGISGDIIPIRIDLLGNRKIIQQEFECVPVGEEKDGTIKLIDNLSYAPADWGDELIAMFSNISDSEERQLAEKCIYKWFAIDWTKYDSSLVLPLLTEISEIKVVEGETKHLPPYIKSQKTIWDGISYARQAEAKVSEGFTIDSKLGIIKFNKPVFYSTQDTKTYTGGISAATVTLIAAYESKTGGVIDFPIWQAILPGGTELPVVYKDNSIVSYWIKNETTEELEEQNTETIDGYANDLLDKLYNYYAPRFPEIRSYPGVVSVGAWGSFRSVTWTLNPESGATTEIQKHIEIPKPEIPGYKEKLLKKKIGALWEVSRRLERVKKIYPYE